MRSGRIVLAAAEEAGATGWIRMLRSSLGMAYLQDGDFATASRCHRQAGEAFVAAEDPVGATDGRANPTQVRLYREGPPGAGRHDAVRHGGTAAEHGVSGGGRIGRGGGGGGRRTSTTSRGRSRGGSRPMVGGSFLA